MGVDRPGDFDMRLKLDGFITGSIKKTNKNIQYRISFNLMNNNISTFTQEVLFFQQEF